MIEKTWVEMVMRVGTTEEVNAFVEISPDGDGLGLVHLCCPTEKGKGWFGNFNFSLSPEIARQVAKAMIAVADEIEKQCGEKS